MNNSVKDAFADIDNIKGYKYHADNMLPLIDPDADVFAKPAQFYDGSGAYMVCEDDRTMIYKCERCVGMVHMHSDNEAYPMRIVTLEWFDERVTALVVGISRRLEKV